MNRPGEHEYRRQLEVSNRRLSWGFNSLLILLFWVLLFWCAQYFECAGTSRDDSCITTMKVRSLC